MSRRLAPWSFVLAFGVVSLLADMVYEGARSAIGPYLGTLGASATLVGLVAGIGEFLGYGLRVASGYLVTRTKHYWAWTITGYALTPISVPLIGVTGVIAPALLLYATERLGKAVRSPAKDTLLSHAASSIGRGKAFGVHQFTDQIGAVAGPLLLALILATSDDNYALAFGVLAVPGFAVLGVLAWLRIRVPDPREYEEDGTPPPRPVGAPPLRAGAKELPRVFWRYVTAIAVISCGVASFPLLAFHAQQRGLLSDALVPVLFAAAMLVDGVSGLVVGRVYDVRGPRVLFAVPVAACGAAVAFADSVAALWVGVMVWGIVNGVLDSDWRGSSRDRRHPPGRDDGLPSNTSALRDAAVSSGSLATPRR